jgi:hypothetical protein
MRPSTLMLTLLVLVAQSAPGIAARVATKPIQHEPTPVYQAYCGGTCDRAGNVVTQGFPANVSGRDVIGAVPGVLVIDPGGTQPLKGWPNFVSASLPTGPADRSWTVTDVLLRKTVPTYNCSVAIGGKPVLLHGSANLRYWWPLMYELPGTEWTLIVTYKTIVWDDDGPGPNPAGTTHQDVWTWRVDATLASMESVVELFHELPVGTCDVPLINGESIYTQLIDNLERLRCYRDPSDPEMTEDFYNFILMLEDYCLTVDCGSCGLGIGIRNTVENPACCKLLADADYVLASLTNSTAP